MRALDSLRHTKQIQESFGPLASRRYASGGDGPAATGHRHPVQIERTDFHEQDGYWKSFWDTEGVFYGHVLGCKGLERRATDELVVVVDPAVTRAVAGDLVARRLGI